MTQFTYHIDPWSIKNIKKFNQILNTTHKFLNSCAYKSNIYFLREYVTLFDYPWNIETNPTINLHPTMHKPSICMNIIMSISLFTSQNGVENHKEKK